MTEYVSFTLRYAEIRLVPNNRANRCKAVLVFVLAPINVVA